MNEIEILKRLVDVNIPFEAPIALAEVSSRCKRSSHFPDIKSEFEFPPKSMSSILQSMLDHDVSELNFFDISRMLKRFELDELNQKDVNKQKFSLALHFLYTQCEHYIQLFILKITTRIFLLHKEHSFTQYLGVHLTSTEFIFIRNCLDKKYDAITQYLQVDSLKSKLQSLTLLSLLEPIIEDYASYLFKKIGTKLLPKNAIELYKNNLLIAKRLPSLYKQLSQMLMYMEQKKNEGNNLLLETIILDRLGFIDDFDSRWYLYEVPIEHVERYKRIKGLFEFQRFIDIGKYLTQHKEIVMNVDEHGSDAKRLNNRSVFWTNYDDRFSSVKMWVSHEDYIFMQRDKPVDIQGIKVFDEINNELCALEFKDSKVLILEFFRSQSDGIKYNSLIFQDDTVEIAKTLLLEQTFTNVLYAELSHLSDFFILHRYLWQGWVDRYLRNRDIYPNDSILRGKLFSSPKKVSYKKQIGLEDTRNAALNENIKYEYVIKKSY
jgi:hypothetical protein